LAKSTLKPQQTFRLSLVGGETLLGRDIKEVLEERSKQTRISTYPASAEGNFSEQEGEPVYLEPLSAESLRDTPVLVLAGSAAGSAKGLGIAQSLKPQPLVLDATGVLAGEKEARLIAPLLSEVKPAAGQLLVVAHPAATALALVLGRLSNHKAITSSVANIFAPASERGSRGIDELHRQTSALLAFKTLPREIFDAQLAFNLLPQLGEDSALPLPHLEERIQRELQLLGAQSKKAAAVHNHSLRLIQAPVFHGYAISLYVEFASKISGKDLEEALASAQVEVRSLGEDVPTNPDAAGTTGVIAGDIRPALGNPKAAWFWLVCDNYRIISDAVADVVNTLASVEGPEHR
jgi:aspartate-semialdehyde dehydrogenase